MLKKLWVLPVDIRLAAHANKLQFRPRSYSYIGSVPVIDVADRPIADWDVVMKWLFDKTVGGLLLIAALPVMALVALAIKIGSRGPLLFKQQRYGFNNDLIEVFIRLKRLGRTSAAYECAAYRVDDDVLMVTAEQTLVLGMGAGRVVPEWDKAKSEFLPATAAHFTLSFDHRVLDGGGAGRLLQRIAALLQEPDKL